MVQYQKFKLYIFDMGNVILDHVDILPSVSNILDTPFHIFDTFYTNYLEKMSTGKLSSEFFWKEYSVNSGQKIDEDYLMTCFHPVRNPKMVELLVSLRKAGCRVVCGTNTYSSHYSYLESCGILKYFDAIYASHIMGIAKPNLEFYRHILREEGIQAERTFFTDDLSENIQAASSLGIHATLFTGIDSIISIL